MVDDKPNWDVFICHATEDKMTFVEPLAEALKHFGLSVWYDKFSMSIGDSLSRTIDEGLARSEYGLVILSKAFLSKKWSEYELRGLTARELAGKKIILPIWHNVTKSDVLQFSPPLADKLAINTENRKTGEIALEVLRAIRPDLHTKIHRRLLFRAAANSSTPIKVLLSDIHMAPIRHRKMSEDLARRIRLVRAALLDFYPQSMAFWMDGFQRDTHPIDEVRYWERIASAAIEFSNYISTDETKKREIFRLLLNISNNVSANKGEARSQILTDEEIEQLSEVLDSLVPVYDFPDDRIFEGYEIIAPTAPADEDGIFEANAGAHEIIESILESEPCKANEDD